MRLTHWTIGMILAAGTILSGAPAFAQECHRQVSADIYHDQRDVRYDQRDLRYDNERIARMRADIERDRFRLNQDIRYGRERAAAMDAQDLARDQRLLDGAAHDVRADRRDLYYDQRDLQHDYRVAAQRRW